MRGKQERSKRDAWCCERRGLSSASSARGRRDRVEEDVGDGEDGGLLAVAGGEEGVIEGVGQKADGRDAPGV